MSIPRDRNQSGARSARPPPPSSLYTISMSEVTKGYAAYASLIQSPLQFLKIFNEMKIFGIQKFLNPVKDSPDFKNPSIFKG